MARPRNFHGLLGSRSFSIPTHEQRNVFFSLNDKMNGVMDNWIKSDANENWERHDFENCTVFNFISNLDNNKSNHHSVPFVMRLNDTSISSFIDATRIGILARINECVYNNLTCMFHHHYKKTCESDYTINSIKGAKHQSIQQIVNITSNIVVHQEISLASIVIPNKDERLLHERQQLLSNGLIININKPIDIDKHLVGKWISISWERKSEKDDTISFVTFDVAKIVSYKNNSFRILYEEDGRKIYPIQLHINDWYDSLESPPTRPYQWRLLSTMVSILFSMLHFCKSSVISHTIPFCCYQVDVVMQHEQNELIDNDLIIDDIKPKLNKDIIGRWISIAFKRECHGNKFLVFDVGVVTELIGSHVYVDYRTDGGIVAVPLQSKDFNCSITCPPSKQYMWRMLLSNERKIKGGN